MGRDNHKQGRQRGDIGMKISAKEGGAVMILMGATRIERGGGRAFGPSIDRRNEEGNPSAGAELNRRSLIGSGSFSRARTGRRSRPQNRARARRGGRTGPRPRLPLPSGSTAFFFADQPGRPGAEAIWPMGHHRREKGRTCSRFDRTPPARWDVALSVGPSHTILRLWGPGAPRAPWAAYAARMLANGRGRCGVVAAAAVFPGR